MNNTFRAILNISSFLLLILSSQVILCQEKPDPGKLNSNDSLSLKSIIEEIIMTHPTIKGAEEALANADARIGLARTGYYPQVDASASFANIGPVLKFTIPDLGTVQLYPANNFSGAINYRQVIYDFGRTKENINIEEQNKVLGEMTLEQVKQKMSLVAVNSFYTIAYLQEATSIKDQQLSTLEEHLRYVKKMKETGSATDYQILTTEVRISTAESQKVDIISALKVQQAYLGSLLGKEDLNSIVREELEVGLPSVNRDSVQSFALRNRNEMLISKERTSLAGLRYDLIRTVNRPIISMSISAGAKNGYIPELNQLRPNYSAGVGINIPIFDGMKTKYNLLQAKSAINNAEFEVENTKRNISSEVREAESYLESAHQKVSQFSLQLDQALKAYALAETSFKAGAITNLELLDANTAVSESRLMLLKARIDYAASIYRLKAALGEKLY
jgi:outer membrane protein